MFESQIKEILESEFIKDGSPIEGQTRLLSSGLISSLSMIDLLGALESRFEVNFDPEELIPEHFDTLDSINRLLVQKKS